MMILFSLFIYSTVCYVGMFFAIRAGKFSNDGCQSSDDYYLCLAGLWLISPLVAPILGFLNSLIYFGKFLESK